MSLTPEQQKYEADMIAHHTPEELVRKLSDMKRQNEELQAQIDNQNQGKQQGEQSKGALPVEEQQQFKGGYAPTLHDHPVAADEPEHHKKKSKR